MNKYRIAFFPLVRNTFDVSYANQLINEARGCLIKAGFELVETPTPISDLETARKAVEIFSNSDVDLTLIFQATFADSTMVVEIAENLPAPLFLWAVPEEWTGGRLRLNSLCGINLAGHSLTLRKKHYDYAYASPSDSKVLEHIRQLASAGNLNKRLRSARLGVVGEHPDGMDTCRLDENTLHETFGVGIEYITLQEVFTRSRSINSSTVAKTRTMLETKLDNLSTLEQNPLNGTLSVFNALKEIIAERNLDGLAVRCWPEFFTELGCAACGAMSMLSDGFGLPAPVPCSCEADINGTLTQVILNFLSGEPAFGTDIVGIDTARDRVALWHCGLAPFSMADPSTKPKGEIHSNRKVPLIMDFPLKPGEVTIARISQATGTLSLVYGSGHMLSEPKPFSGTAGVLKPDCTAGGFLERMMRDGYEHHVSLVYGNYLQELKFYADLINLPAVNL